MHNILVSGSVAYDRIMNFRGTFKEHFHPDKIHVLSVSFVVDSLEESYGGTAGNIAYNFYLLKQNPIVVSSAGHDFDKYREYFRTLGISTDSVQTSQLEATATAHVITDDEDNQIAAFYPGALANAYVGEIPHADLCIIAPGNPKDMVALAEVCRTRNTPFFFDPGQQTTALSADDFRAALTGAALLIGNDYEMEMIQKKLNTDMRGLLAIVPVVVTTLGAEGSHIQTREAEFRVPGVKAIQAIDPTGAGDAFRAGFASAWLQKFPLDICAQIASTVAVYAVESYGTQRHAFTLDQLKERYAKSYDADFPW